MTHATEAERLKILRAMAVSAVLSISGAENIVDAHGAEVRVPVEQWVRESKVSELYPYVDKHFIEVDISEDQEEVVLSLTTAGLDFLSRIQPES